jgi:hypothetical protein
MVLKDYNRMGSVAKKESLALSLKGVGDKTK